VTGPNERRQDQKGESDDCRGTADPRNRRTNTVLSATTEQIPLLRKGYSQALQHQAASRHGPLQR
jgi:hypothetical protein